MHIFKTTQQAIHEVLKQCVTENLLPSVAEQVEFTTEPPRETAHGDIATNIAMVLAKPAGKNPRAIAEMLLPRLLTLPSVSSVEIAGPGFINLRLKPEIWQQEIYHILQKKEHYGASSMGKGKTVHVEYVSANPTGPMHIGHARGAVVGDALAELLKKAGFNVVKEYYINDAGGQIETLARSAFLRYREALGENIEISKGLYPGEYLKPVGEALAQHYGKKLLEEPEAQWLPQVKRFAVSEMMKLIKKDLADLGIYHDVFVSEWSLHEANKVQETLDHLKEKNLIYRGILEAPKGKTPEDWEAREQTLFKATEFGDDTDRPLQKSDGSWTYFAGDIAYHLDKIQRGFMQMVLILGADHGGYVKRMKAAIAALSNYQASIEIKLCQMVNFLENGIPLKMSKRAGNFTTVHDVTEAVGKEVLRFIMLTRKNDMVLDFDLEKVKEQSKDNPVFYVQYAYARTRSVLRHAAEEFPEIMQKAKQQDASLLQYLQSEEELALIKHMAAWPRLVESAATAYEPHRIAFYLQELAAEFHALWNKGKENADLRFLMKEEPKQTAARLMLMEAFGYVVASGFALFAITPAEELRG